ATQGRCVPGTLKKCPAVSEGLGREPRESRAGPPRWSCSQVKVLHTKRPRQLMRQGKGIYARGSSGKAGGVIRHCRKVKTKRGSVFQPTLLMAGLPITLRSLIQCAADEKPPSEPAACCGGCQNAFPRPTPPRAAGAARIAKVRFF